MAMPNPEIRDEPALRVEALGKEYLLDPAQQKNETFRELLTRVAIAPWRSMGGGPRLRTERFWALSEASFSVAPGESVAIIGRNGAGKSTLLKLISKITEPSTGRIELRGRVASLLEVGTGFHQELTGRENVFLSGSILGMSRSEIRRKFDEIVSFAQVETFLDMPVKRYSSGMQMRLAFAVAAHLDSEIVLVDEVLAVGDAAFQRRCLGKMSEVTRHGRTVLFVSHNMGAVIELCPRAILLDRGKIVEDGPAREVVDAYTRACCDGASVDLMTTQHAGPGEFARLSALELLDTSGVGCTSFPMGGTLVARMRIRCHRAMPGAEIGLKISSRSGVALHYLVSSWEGLRYDLTPGDHEFEIRVPEVHLFPGRYTVGVWLSKPGYWSDDNVQNATSFEVVSRDLTGYQPYYERYGVSGCESYTCSRWSGRPLPERSEP